MTCINDCDGGCEFCPAVITDRDPGDETPEYVVTFTLPFKRLASAQAASLSFLERFGTLGASTQIERA